MHDSIHHILDKMRSIANGTLAKNAEAIDEKAQWPEEALREIQRAGLAGLVLPIQAGGLGQGLFALVQSCEILAQECASSSMCFGMHCVGSAVLAAKATPEQTEEFLRPIAEGKHITTLALSEKGSGAHFYFPQSQLTEKDDQFFLLNGNKSFVTNGNHADSYVMSTVGTEDDLSLGKFSCVIVTGHSEGMKWMKPWNGLGMRGNSSCSVTLNDVKIPKNNLLGQEGDQLWYVFEVVAPYFLMAMAGTYLGIATAALNEATEHLKKRQYSHSGSSLSKQPVLQHKLGTLWSNVERSRRLIYSAALLGDEGRPESLLSILSAKADVADCVVNTVNEVMTLMGGMAYGENSKLSRHLRDARASHVMAPTTDILRTWTGRALLGLPLLGD